jgi:hypothetical protein
MMTATTIGVDAVFAANGRIQVRRIELDGHWLPVEQGRHWLNEAGLHVLVMVNGRVREIRLSPDTLIWEIVPTRQEIA